MVETPSKAGRNEFAAMARKCEQALIRAARRLCRGNDDRAQDLVQEALIRAYQAFLSGNFREGSDPRPWLTRILTNLFINEEARRKRWEAGIDVDTLTSSGDAGPESTHAPACEVPGVTMLSEILDEELERALAMLTDPLRLCVILVDIEGLDYAEAAAALGVPIGTVRSRLSRARMQLHDLLMGFGRRRGLVE